MLKIGFIGAGVMGSAMAQAWSLVPHVQLFAHDPHLERAKSLMPPKTTFVAHNAQLWEHCDWVVLAVKPQAIHALFQEDWPYMHSTLCLSIAAGISMAHLQSKIPSSCQIVRLMPNTPALIQEGCLGAWSDTPIQHPELTGMLESLGKVFWLNTETQIDAFTALIGSGPAYIYAFMEALEHAGNQIGLPAALLPEMLSQLLRGSLELWQSRQIPFSRLREEVTSPKGTTQAALEVLKTSGFDASVEKAIQAAWQRALELRQKIP